MNKGEKFDSKLLRIQEQMYENDFSKRTIMPSEFWLIPHARMLNMSEAEKKDSSEPSSSKYRFVVEIIRCFLKKTNNT